MKEAQGDLSGAMGDIDGLGIFPCSKRWEGQALAPRLLGNCGLWILADQRAPKAFTLSRLSFCEQKERDLI